MVLRIRKPDVTVYVRHRESCEATDKGESYPKCDCPKWLRWSVGGKQHRLNAETRTWGLAEEKATEQQKRVEAGLSGKPITSAEKQPTIAEAVDTFLNQKIGAG